MINQLNVTSSRPPMYDQNAVQPMRDELTWVGFNELMNPAEVDEAIQKTPGTTFVLINSVCGCAAGSARPGATAALQHTKIPDNYVTVFAGQERDAVDRMRELIGQPPSSPSMAVFQDGELQFFLPRHEIEGRSAEQIAGILMQVFDKIGTKEGPSIPKEQYDQLVHARMCGSKIPRHESA